MSAPRKPNDKRRWIWLKDRRGNRSPKLRRKPVIFAPLPTILTLANGLCGLTSAAIATGTILHLPRNEAVFYAGLLIFGGMFFDMLDGQAARWLKQASNFGEQMDSLCDVITFGVAPVFILLTYSHLLPVRLTFGIGAIYISCVLLRLARFNAEKSHSDSHEFFSGLPSPAAAGTVASFAVSLPGVEQFTDERMNEWVRSASSRLVDAAMVALPLLTMIVALLMVSRFRYSHVVNRWIRQKYRYHDLTRIILVVVAGVTIHELVLPLLFCSFALEPPLASIWSGLTRPFRKESPEPQLATHENLGEVEEISHEEAG